MKLRKISDIRPTLGFREYDFIQKYRDSFKNSELGRIYEQLPLMEIGDWFMVRLPRKTPQGNKPMLRIEGEIVLRRWPHLCKKPLQRNASAVLWHPHGKRRNFGAAQTESR